MTMPTKDEPKKLTYSDACCVHGICFHGVHARQSREGDSIKLLYPELQVCRELESEPEESRESIEARSRALARLDVEMPAFP